MDDDEEKLVLRRRIRQTFLEPQQLGDLEIAPVRELSILFAEARGPGAAFDQFAAADEEYWGFRGPATSEMMGVPTSTRS